MKLIVFNFFRSVWVWGWKWKINGVFTKFKCVFSFTSLSDCLSTVWCNLKDCKYVMMSSLCDRHWGLTFTTYLWNICEFTVKKKKTTESLRMFIDLTPAEPRHSECAELFIYYFIYYHYCWTLQTQRFYVVSLSDVQFETTQRRLTN